jgi:hypothetical protein
MTKKNILLITVDCLRLDHGCHILEELKKSSLSIEGLKLMATITPGPYTPMAFSSIMTGIPAIFSRNSLPL